MQQYFKQIIAKLTAQHTEALRLSDNPGELGTPYKEMAANLWDRKCDTEAHLAEWERQNARDAALFNGTVASFSVWTNIDSAIRFVIEESAVEIALRPKEGRTLLETFEVLKDRAYGNLFGDNSSRPLLDLKVKLAEPEAINNQPEINEQESHSGC